MLGPLSYNYWATINSYNPLLHSAQVVLYMLQLQHLYLYPDSVNNDQIPLRTVYEYRYLSCSLVLQTGACHSEEGPWRLAGTQTLLVLECSLPWLCAAPPAVPHSFPAGG